MTDTYAKNTAISAKDAEKLTPRAEFRVFEGQNVGCEGYALQSARNAERNLHSFQEDR